MTVFECKPAKPRSRFLFGTGGSTSLEYAIVFPALFFLVVGSIDVARLIWTSAILSRAVAMAARCSVVNTAVCSSASATQQYALTQAWTLNASIPNFSVVSQSCGLSVSARYAFTFFVPGVSGLTLSPSACYPQ